MLLSKFHFLSSDIADDEIVKELLSNLGQVNSAVFFISVLIFLYSLNEEFPLI